MTDGRELMLEIFTAGIQAVEPGNALRRIMGCSGRYLEFGGQAHRRTYDLSSIRHVLVVGCGKAGAPMAAAVESVAGEKCAGGTVTVKYGHAQGVGALRTVLLEASHPVPDQAGQRGAESARELLRSAGPDDLVVAVISGGGSALWPLPAPGLTLEEKLLTTNLLLGCGADIGEVNCVRKHLSSIKGGHAARLASNAQAVEVLLVSDVVGDHLDVIASGPFAPDISRYADALYVIDKYSIRESLPESVLRHLERGAQGGLQETPKAGEPCFRSVHHTVCASNTVALEAAAGRARGLGLDVHMVTQQVVGNVDDAADFLANAARKYAGSVRTKPLCVISGGETTVVLGDKPGMGGRNQELALLWAVRVAGLEGVSLLSCGTDGTDGPTDAAGAVADGTTVSKGAALGIDAQAFLAAHDSYRFFDGLGGLVKTGPTKTNVMDMQVMLVC